MISVHGECPNCRAIGYFHPMFLGTYGTCYKCKSDVPILYLPVYKEEAMGTDRYIDETQWKGTHKPWMRPIEGELNATLNNSTKHSLNRWDQFFLSLAEFYAQRSKDPSTKCGAIIARGNRQISQGFNGFPMLVNDDPKRYQDRELKLQMILHAEVNAILFAKVDLTGTTIYTWPFPPCCRCAAVIIQSGIRKVVAPAPSGALEDRWAEELRVAKLMYADAGVELVEVRS